jgi:hypothetical protein
MIAELTVLVLVAATNSKPPDGKRGCWPLGKTALFLRIPKLGRQPSEVYVGAIPMVNLMAN